MIRIFIFSIVCIWISSCKTSTKALEVYQNGEIALDLYDKVSPRKIESDFELYGLKLLCIEDDKSNTVIYSFNMNFIERDILIGLLTEEVGIEEAKKTRGCVY